MPVKRVQGVGHELLTLRGVDGPARVAVVPPGVHSPGLELPHLPSSRAFSMQAPWSQHWGDCPCR